MITQFDRILRSKSGNAFTLTACTQVLKRLAIAAFFISWPLRIQAIERPNIVVIMTDDLAPFDISAYHRGLGAVSTKNIDRIAREGLMISDYYAQPSCTAGRAAFLTGQYPIRTGLTSVGQPGSPIGLHREDVTLAQSLPHAPTDPRF